MQRVSGLYTRYPGAMTPRNAFSVSFRRILSGTLAKTVHPKTRNLDASGTDDVRSVRGMPPLSPTERMYVRLRRYTTVLTAHDYMELGTAMLWSIAYALSRIVRQGNGNSSARADKS
jgi:hypothetical protein